jgi:hypothetical protein
MDPQEQERLKQKQEGINKYLNKRKEDLQEKIANKNYNQSMLGLATSLTVGPMLGSIGYNLVKPK